MKTRFRSEDDGWTPNGLKITTPEAMDAVRRCLDEEGPIIVEHWFYRGFYRGSCAPDRMVFKDFEAFSAYLEANEFAGDAIHVWSFPTVCRNDNALLAGKCPDEDGFVPARG